MMSQDTYQKHQKVNNQRIKCFIYFFDLGINDNDKKYITLYNILLYYIYLLYLLIQIKYMYILQHVCFLFSHHFIIT